MNILILLKSYPCYFNKFALSSEKNGFTIEWSGDYLQTIYFIFFKLNFSQ